MTKKIFLSTCDHSGSVYTIRNFREFGFTVIAGDANPDAIGRFFADAFYCLPRQDEPFYFPAVTLILENEEIDYYVPSGERECLHAARMRDWLDCVVVAPDEYTIWVAMDKPTTYCTLRTAGVKVPDYHVVRNAEEYWAGIEKLGGLLCVKPAVGSGTRGFVVLRDPTLDEVMGRAEFTFLSRQTYGEMLEGKDFPPLVLMEYVDAPLFDSNVVCKDGEILWQSVKTREKAVRGTITRGAIIRSEYIEETNRRIVKALGTTGLISVQYAGETVLEINPRWSTSLRYGGIDEYLMSMDLWTGAKIEVGDIDDYVGHRMIRYWDILTYREDSYEVV